VNPDPTAGMIPISTFVAIVAPVVGALVTAIGLLFRALLAEQKARVEDVRAAGIIVAETQQKMLPLMERVALELRIMNERRAHRAKESDPPPSSSSLDDTLRGIIDRARDEAEAAVVREIHGGKPR
jgi:hypothetical protein